MKIVIAENRIGSKQELNGYFIYCVNGGIECSSWWSSPGNRYGDVQYLRDRGYRNIRTNQEYRIFSQITRVMLAKIKAEEKYYRIVLKPNKSTGYNKKYVTWLNQRRNKLSLDFKDAQCFNVEQMVNAIQNNFINFERYVIQEIKQQDLKYYL